MKLKDILADPNFLSALRGHPPRSKYSGKPLTLTAIGYGTSLCWEYCMEPDWWVDQQDGVYTRQDSRLVLDEEIIAAAAQAGIDVDLVVLALANREHEYAAAHAADQLDAARREGYSSYADMEAAQSKAALADTSARRARSRAALLEKMPHLANTDLARAAEAEIAAHLAAHPQIERLTRKLELVDAHGQRLAVFRNKEGMQAWLYQHGLTPGIRHAFLDAAK